jgi:hypothetical protein
MDISYHSRWPGKEAIPTFRGYTLERGDSAGDDYHLVMAFEFFSNDGKNGSPLRPPNPLRAVVSVPVSGRQEEDPNPFQYADALPPGMGQSVIMPPPMIPRSSVPAKNKDLTRMLGEGCGP